MIRINESESEIQSFNKDKSIIIKELKKEGFSDKEITQIINALKKAYNESIKVNESFNKTLRQFIKEDFNLTSTLTEAAKDALILDKNSKYIVASQIALNLQGEYDAIEGYDKLIPFLEKYNDQESINHIREIISDENNHSMLLREIMKKYDGNIPVAKD